MRETFYRFVRWLLGADAPIAADLTNEPLGLRRLQASTGSLDALRAINLDLPARRDRWHRVARLRKVSR